MKILVTGGTGYIGSHTCVQLIEKGWQPVIIDSLVNSKISVLDRIQQITGTRPAFIEGDVRNADLLQKVLTEHAIEAVIHFAGLKAVGESVSMPLKYYDNSSWQRGADAGHEAVPCQNIGVQFFGHSLWRLFCATLE